MLQNVGVSWEWKGDAHCQPLTLEYEELAEVITAWPLLPSDLGQVILAIVRSANVVAEASCAATECASIPLATQRGSTPRTDLDVSGSQSRFL